MVFLWVTQGNGSQSPTPQPGYHPTPLYSLMSKVPTPSPFILLPPSHCMFSIPPCSSPHPFTGLKSGNPAHMSDPLTVSMDLMHGFCVESQDQVSGLYGSVTEVLLSIRVFVCIPRLH